MKISEVDINKIETLLKSVPSGADLESITFIGNEYQLHIIAGTNEIKKVKMDESLSELRRILNQKYLE